MILRKNSGQVVPLNLLNFVRQATHGDSNKIKLNQEIAVGILVPHVVRTDDIVIEVVGFVVPGSIVNLKKPPYKAVLF